MQRKESGGISMSGLERFIKAQEGTYNVALEEIKNGYKESHWMWFVFPQLKGLGRSPMAEFYGIVDRDEAIAYLLHPVLGKRLREISEILLQVFSDDAEEVMGWPDNLKLKSSMTLFYLVSGEDIFMEVLVKFFGGEMDEVTKRML